MKVNCTKENLYKSLDLVSHVASKSSNLPILSNVLLRVKNGIIELISTDLEIGIKSLVRGKIETEGEFTIPATLFSNYINLLQKEKIEIFLQDKEIIIKTEDSTTKIKGENSEEFPILPEINKNKSVSVEAEDFKKAITQIIFATAQDETRPEISGVYFKFSGQELIVAATDSYRLAEKKIKLKQAVENKTELILPSKTLQELLRIISINQTKTVDIYLDENQIMFVCDETELISRIIEGQYPDYTQLIPADFKTNVSLDRNDFIKVIKTSSLFTKSGVNDIVLSVRPEEKILVVESTNNQLGENIAKIEAGVTGEECKIVFNYRYLLDGLGATSADEIILSVNDANSPGLIKSKTEDKYIYIIMPIRQ